MILSEYLNIGRNHFFLIITILATSGEVIRKSFFAPFIIITAIFIIYSILYKKYINLICYVLVLCLHFFYYYNFGGDYKQQLKDLLYFITPIYVYVTYKSEKITSHNLVKLLDLLVLIVVIKSFFSVIYLILSAESSVNFYYISKDFGIFAYLIFPFYITLPLLNINFNRYIYVISLIATCITFSKLYIAYSLIVLTINSLYKFKRYKYLLILSFLINTTTVSYLYLNNQNFHISNSITNLTSMLFMTNKSPSSSSQVESRESIKDTNIRNEINNKHDSFSNIDFIDIDNFFTIGYTNPNINMRAYETECFLNNINKNYLTNNLFTTNYGVNHPLCEIQSINLGTYIIKDFPIFHNGFIFIVFKLGIYSLPLLCIFAYIFNYSHMHFRAYNFYKLYFSFAIFILMMGLHPSLFFIMLFNKFHLLNEK